MPLQGATPLITHPRRRSQGRLPLGYRLVAPLGRFPLRTDSSLPTTPLPQGAAPKVACRWTMDTLPLWGAPQPFTIFRRPLTVYQEQPNGP
ncbi:MAG: hypothetical protein J6S02_07580 [Bacteroidaceae bacterium]|nr:hypothetical protein [Bacteroidaceae bacterium]